MVDATTTPPAAAPKHGSLSKSSALLRRRRWAEWRLKAYGIAAILAAAFALVSLLGSTIFKASEALTETHVSLEIELSPEALELGPNPTPTEIARADYNALMLDSLRERFPNATGRTERRELSALLSRGAPFILADEVAANPEMLGETIRYPFLGSDTTDLYFKGVFGELNRKQTSGLLSVTEAEDGTLDVSSSANDFTEALRLAKLDLVDEARILRRQAGRQERAVRVYTERAAAAETEEDRADQVRRAESADAKRADLIAEAEELEARAASAGVSEEIDEDNRSVLIAAGGGWIKLTEINRSVAKGVALTPVTLPIENAEAWTHYSTDLPEAQRRISDNQIVWLETLERTENVDVVFNSRFFSAADSRAPELAGIRGAVVGSALTMLVTLVLAFPIGVLGAIYLEEFAPKNRFTRLVEVNINNLAAVPSIVFGLLGLAVFLGFFGVPRSSPLAGGIVLALMTLPTIIIAARAAIRAVPPSIREAALGVGASNVQASFHHVLPLAMPGILTGTIIGMAQALGETAPLIMIGMVAFIVEVPSGITDSATVLPVQVFRWSDFPERAFEARTAAAICVLLVFLVFMNLLAIILRRRFERRW